MPCKVMTFHIPGRTSKSGTLTSGNPISYFNGTRWSFDWRNGRELSIATATDPTGLIDTAITYEYDVNGLRTGTSHWATCGHVLWSAGRNISSKEAH